LKPFERVRILKQLLLFPRRKIKSKNEEDNNVKEEVNLLLECQELVDDLQSIFNTLKGEQSWNNVGAKSLACICKQISLKSYLIKLLQRKPYRVQQAAGEGCKGYQNKSKQTEYLLFSFFASMAALHLHKKEAVMKTIRVH
jgi:hypothetical protein